MSDSLVARYWLLNERREPRDDVREGGVTKIDDRIGGNSVPFGLASLDHLHVPVDHLVVEKEPDSPTDDTDCRVHYPIRNL